MYSSAELEETSVGGFGVVEESLERGTAAIYESWLIINLRLSNFLRIFQAQNFSGTLLPAGKNWKGDPADGGCDDDALLSPDRKIIIIKMCTDKN